jgi:hypothetical protein
MTLIACITFYSFAIGQVSEQDSLALVALYNVTDGDHWTDNANWLNGPISSWYGITIQNNQVTEIELQNNFLTGIIPDEIGSLTELKALKLALNNLMGPIPGSIGDLALLEELSLSKNELTGLVPEEIGLLTSLQKLVLFENQLIGPLPDLSALQDLQELVLGKNDFSGPFPEWILDMPNLTFVGFRSAGITGNLPSNLLQALPNLDHLRMDNNLLEGDISVWYHGATPMTTLDIYNNRFYGVMQDSVVDVDISTFSIGRNLIEGVPDFSGATEMKSYFGIDQNRIGFHELEKALNVSTFSPFSLLLSPQNSLLDEETIFIKEGESVTISSGSMSEQDAYQWFKDGAEIPGATGRVYVVESYVAGDAGIYHCEITNPQFEFALERSSVILQTDGTTSISGLSEFNVAVFPNPVANKLVIETDGFQGVSILDLNGRQLMKSHRSVLDVSMLAGGSYVLLIDTGNGMAIRQITKFQ